ncbi:hypothetical protein BD311DRAFT_98202 [Dichomitus squalens]|uniref:Uncharacterized protein n=1 Tax=Dichomitus squalens TaxID=114155 RepID=A0A4Q9MVY6_9APHY|nr:hypothetical protein BD311DRAFT_98202 [Dichomitus squalens]
MRAGISLTSCSLRSALSVTNERRILRTRSLVEKKDARPAKRQERTLRATPARRNVSIQSCREPVMILYIQQCL